MDVIKLSDFAPDVTPPTADERVGWLERTPDGAIVNWGPITELQLVGDAGQGDTEGDA